MDPLFEGNVRTVLSPKAYVVTAAHAGWQLVGSQTIIPDKNLEDGGWEIQFAREVARNIKSEQQEGDETPARITSLNAHADALEASIHAVGGVEHVSCMDVWTAVFQPSEQSASGAR